MQRPIHATASPRRSLGRAWRAARVALLAGCFAAGCARSAKDPVVGSSAPDTASTPPPAAPQQKKPPHEPVADDAVERAALPFHGLREEDDSFQSASEFLDELATANAVCVGENHGSPRDHYAQLALLRGLAERAHGQGRELALGLEMIEQPLQPVLDAYAARQISEAQFLEDSEWQERWGYPFALYRPLLEFARDSGMELIALNAPRELARKIARSGVAALAEPERQKLPEMNLTNAAHRAHFDDAMRDHPRGHGKPENMYAAQVLWDEAMADVAARWLLERAPARQMLILAGRGHCIQSAIPERVRRRGNLRSVGVMPLSEPREPKSEPRMSRFDYVLVFEADSKVP